MSTSPQLSPDELLQSEQTFDLVQTAHGDWIIPALNGLHFVGNQANAHTDQNMSFAQNVLKHHFTTKLHKEDSLFVIIGSDSGQLIRYVQSIQPLPRGSRWVFIEPDPIADILRKQPDIAELLGDYVHLISPAQWPETAQLLLLDDYFRINGVVFEQSLAALDHTTPVYHELTGELDAELSRRRYITTANLGKLPFIKAQLGNIPNFLNNLVPLKGIFKGKKALILAGGPSLDLEIDWIKANRDRLFLIAVSRISARLLATGIYPDLIATVDPHPISLTVSRQMFDLPPQTILVAGNHAYPGIINRWPHHVLYTDTLLPWEERPDTEKQATRLNDKENLVSVGPTVTHTCVMLAAYLGFTEIAFAGLDLCHSPEGQTHAQGSSEAKSGPLLDYTPVQVTTNQGEIAWTTPDYYAGIESMERLAAYLAPQGIKLFNPSCFGAAITGVLFRPLQDIDWPEEPFDRSPLDTLDQPDSVILEHIEHVESAIKQMSVDVEKIERLAQLAMESNQAFYRMLNPERQAMHHRRIRAIDRLMRRRLPEAEDLVKSAAQHELFATDLPHDFFALDAKHAEQLAHRFYDAIRRSAHYLGSLFPNIEYRLQTRRLEIEGQHSKKKIPAEEILERYEQAEEPERALWLQKRWQLTDEDTVKTATIYQEKIDALIEQDQKRNAAKRSPKASLRLAEMYFSHHNLVALQSLGHALSTHPDPAQAAPYHAYILGLEAELKQQPEQAFSAYESVLNTSETTRDTTLIEHCLLRVASTSLALNDDQLANQALDMAAQLNPAHWSLSGKLATARQDFIHAVEAYTNYLTTFPGDSQRIRLLAEQFARLNSTEGIKQCLSLVDYCAPTEKAELREELEALLRGKETV